MTTVQEHMGLVIKYTNILNTKGVGSPESEAFRLTHVNNAIILERADALDDLFILAET